MFLLLNPSARAAAAGGDLPVSMYESIIDLVGTSSSSRGDVATGKSDRSPSTAGPTGEARMLFLPLSYTLATEDAERIGLDHVARISGASDEAQSKVAEHVLVQHSAIKMLASR